MKRIRKRFSFTLEPSRVLDFKQYCEYMNISMSRCVENFMIDSIVNKNIREKVEEITNTKYNIGDESDMIYDLINVINELKDEMYDIKQDVRDNYKPIPKEDQYE